MYRDVLIWIGTLFCTKSSDQGMFQGGDQAARRRGRSSKANIYKVSC